MGNMEIVQNKQNVKWKEWKSVTQKSATRLSAFDFQEFKMTSAARIDRIERLILEIVKRHDTVKTDDIKQQIEWLQNEYNRFRMKSESLLKIIALLSVP